MHDEPSDSPFPAQERPWRLWVDAHLPKLALFARQQTRSDADAEDVLQDAIIESWQRSDGSPPDLALVFTTIRRRAIDLGRRLQVRQNFVDSADVQLETLHDPLPEKREEAALLREAVGGLKPEFQEVVTLKIWGGLTFDEISKVLSISPNTAASRHRLALGHLRKALDHLRP